MRVAIACVLCVVAGCSESRTLGGDAGSDREDVDVVGAWHDCLSSFTYEPTGRVVYLDHRSACRAEGTWDVEGATLTIRWGSSSCEGTSGEAVRDVVRTGAGLVTVDRATGATSQLADDRTPRARWVLEGGETGAPIARSIARVVGSRGDPFASGCYWSADGACGGVFSCSGEILEWSIDASGAFQGASRCGGECPCGATFTGMVQEDGAIDATFRGANCDRPTMGSFVAHREDDPPL